MTKIDGGVVLLRFLTQPDDNSGVKIAEEEYKHSKIRDPSGLVVSQVPH
jgi:hypothetical protein